MAEKIIMYSNYMRVSRCICVWVCIEEMLMANEVENVGKRKIKGLILRFMQHQVNLNVGIVKTDNFEHELWKPGIPLSASFRSVHPPVR